MGHQKEEVRPSFCAWKEEQGELLLDSKIVTCLLEPS